VASQSEGAASGRRHGGVAFAFGAMFLGYTDRVNLAVAAVAMRPQLHWSQSEKGLVLASSSFRGYFLFQVASGSLAQRFGGKNLLTVAAFWWSACTRLTRSLPPHRSPCWGGGARRARPRRGGSAARLLRPLQPLDPAGERGRAVGRFMCGIPLGQIAGLALTGYLTARAGWPASFYLFGALGLVWTLAFIFPGLQRPGP
jgi:MFS transporter, ACS family, solute carrier family 17 (sodium-dependent inorganic phosphate cotransporter), other